MTLQVDGLFKRCYNTYMNKTNIILGLLAAVVVAIVVLLVYAVYSDITDPKPAKAHGSYAHCEYRVAKGACGKWTTKTY